MSLFLFIGQKGEKEPWCLATNLPDRTLTLRFYKRTQSVWIEEMFGDMKGHGFDLEGTMLRHFSRLSRLTWLLRLCMCGSFPMVASLFELACATWWIAKIVVI